jgi:flagellar motor switch protein FliM
MTEQPILSGDEIAALMGREEPSARQEGKGEPRPFSFGSGSAQPTAALPALDRINERFARRIRDLIEPFIRAKPKVGRSATGRQSSARSSASAFTASSR